MRPSQRVVPDRAAAGRRTGYRSQGDAGIPPPRVSSERFTREDLRQAMNVGLEHGCCHPETNVTHCDPILTARLAIAHLRERRDLYKP